MGDNAMVGTYAIPATILQRTYNNIIPTVIK